MYKVICSLLMALVVNNYTSKKIKLTPKNFSSYNRQAIYKGGTVTLNSQKNDGMLWLNDFSFSNGTIELDIKGKNLDRNNYVGIAFHAKDNATYDAIYFRPSNFNNPNNKNHDIQYISMPNYSWKQLRDEFPKKYESDISPQPKMKKDWFHVKIAVDDSIVKVYVDGATKSCLTIEKISKLHSGKLGFWAGNYSRGQFKNLVVTRKE